MNEPSFWVALSDPNFRFIVLLAFTASAVVTMIFAILAEITTPTWDGDFLGHYSKGDDHGQP
jgi:hypothetical protein